jgi:hypothetical protein
MIDTVLCVLPLVLQDRSEVKTAILHLFLQKFHVTNMLLARLKLGKPC